MKVVRASSSHGDARPCGSFGHTGYFGFPSVYLHRFHTVIMYPDTYRSTITEAYHQGEVNFAGIIVLSWKNLLQGYLDPHDGRNLGLHEMAHALKISDATSQPGFDFFDQRAFHDFIHYGRYEMQLIVNGEASFFRQYACSNDHEFFAVEIENFFERPLEFHDFHPEMYASLARLLNQDPLKGVQRIPESKKYRTDKSFLSHN